MRLSESGCGFGKGCIAPTACLSLSAAGLAVLLRNVGLADPEWKLLLLTPAREFRGDCSRPGMPAVIAMPQLQVPVMKPPQT